MILTPNIMKSLFIKEREEILVKLCSAMKWLIKITNDKPNGRIQKNVYIVLSWPLLSGV